MKLATASAKHKFFFITDAATYAIMKRRYAEALSGITIVLLAAGEDTGVSPDENVMTPMTP